MSTAITPSTDWPVACLYMSAIARALQTKSAVAFTDCHSVVGLSDPKTSAVPAGTGRAIACLSVRSRMPLWRSKVRCPPLTLATA